MFKMKSELMLDIGRLRLSLSGLDVPRLNDAVLEGEGSIPHFAEVAVVLDKIESQSGGRVAALVTTFGDKITEGAVKLVELVVTPAMKELSRHAVPALREVSESLVQLVLWHRYPGARDFLAASTKQLKAAPGWSEEKTAAHREYLGKLQLEREFNSVVETCRFSGDGRRIECARGAECKRAKRQGKIGGPFSLVCPGSKPSDSDYLWSVRNWRQPSSGSKSAQTSGGKGGCTFECFPYLVDGFDPAAAPPATVSTAGSMDAFASVVPVATAALSISSQQEEMQAELTRLKQLDCESLVADFVREYGFDELAVMSWFFLSFFRVGFKITLPD